jgi:hypothetical protein
MTGNAHASTSRLHGGHLSAEVRISTGAPSLALSLFHFSRNGTVDG